MKPITKNRESIREGLRLWQSTGKMPEITDGAREIMAKIQFIFEECQTLKVIDIDDFDLAPKKKNKHLKNPEKIDLPQSIAIKKRVIDLVQEKFAPISYMQACIDYQFATEVFNFEIFADATLKLNLAEEEAFESYISAKDSGDLGAAEKFLGHYIKIQQAKPTKPREQHNRPTKIVIEWNPYLIKGCEVVETQEELDILEETLRKTFSNSSTKTLSNLMTKYAQDVESIDTDK
jgi:hypothetical protein